MAHQRGRLSEQDKLILYHLQFIGDRSLPELASELRLRESSLQSKVARWEKEGAVAQRVFINSFSIGISEVEVFFTPTKTSKRDQADLVKIVSASPGVCWFYRTAGKHDFILGLEGPSMAHITRHLEELDSKRSGIFSFREIGSRLDIGGSAESTWRPLTRGMSAFCASSRPPKGKSLTRLIIAFSEWSDRLVLCLIGNLPGNSICRSQRSDIV